MKKKLLFILCLFFTISLNARRKETHYEISLDKVPMNAIFTNGDDNKYSVWGASMVKGEDGLYHIFYSNFTQSG